MNYTLYHNPKCSKSRQTLELLQSRNIDVNIVEYLSHPPDLETLKDLAKKLGPDASLMIRKKEPQFKELQLKNEFSPQWLEAIVENPILLERPILSTPTAAKIGRPPEAVLTLLD